MHILIAPNGDVWDPGDPALYRYLDYAGTAGELYDYAVRNLGCAFISTAPSFWRIKIRPDFFPRGAFERTVQMLDAGRPPRVGIEQDLEDPHFCILSDVGDIVALLSELRAGTDPAVFRSRYSSDPQAIERLDHSGPPVLASALRSWKRRRGKWDGKYIRRLLDHPTEAPLMVVRIDADRVPITETIPRYVTLWGDTDPMDLVGKPMINHPDRDYTSAASASFIASHLEERPTFEIVNAFIQSPHGPTQWVRYDRLVLPWCGPDGSRFVSSVPNVRVYRRSAELRSR